MPPVLPPLRPFDKAPPLSTLFPRPRDYQAVLLAGIFKVPHHTILPRLETTKLCFWQAFIQLQFLLRLPQGVTPVNRYMVPNSPEPYVGHLLTESTASLLPLRCSLRSLLAHAHRPSRSLSSHLSVVNISRPPRLCQHIGLVFFHRFATVKGLNFSGLDNVGSGRTCLRHPGRSSKQSL